MDSRFKEWVYIEGLMQSAYHEAALKMNLWSVPLSCCCPRCS